MCCGAGYGGRMHAHGHQHGSGSGHGRGCCCHGSGFHRRVLTRQEELAQLEAYLKDLQEEIKTVEERIKGLKG